MKKVLNKPENFVEEFMEGLVLAYGDQVSFLNEDKRILVRAQNNKTNKVGIVTAGGSGHLPLFCGYVGEGMIDGCAIGNVFASPSASKMATMIRACDTGKGVLCLYGNYGGDKMNFELAQEEVDFDDIKTVSVLAMDDIASSPANQADKRRGVAGLVYAYKIAGASADRGDDLDTVAETTRAALANIRSMGFALSPCILPEVGEPSFHIADDEIEVGMGIHGEPGIETRKMMTADEIADTAFATINQELCLKTNDEVSIMINGLGATPKEELLIVFRRLHHLLSEQQVNVVMPHIGEYATSMEMAGLSVTIFKLTEEQKSLLGAPAKTPFYTNCNL
ncbi:MAG: dihydroxyacetone kinase subunit DhaK [Eubacteriales bacterium]|nr:dihydroxyacetone kinase subunit DhaK [Eubacteriales bacterium]